MKQPRVDVLRLGLVVYVFEEMVSGARVSNGLGFGIWVGQRRVGMSKGGRGRGGR